ncbi:DUF4236 domain-containing protein [Metabacillus rhizolycopersici]|uniref:DUF4236 domain-containing protein n=1 Tax=Metabacillus rhizolycopersici TaxID=2875709 RepID=A0ABS7UXE1_9BACI|nr:DUF4236 domain-containing protein [Metabacillus rhizolycopersici]MBZ5752605.1 DUF4236 domain-containing protein [Metabacillus rhizolycopersici]
MGLNFRKSFKVAPGVRVNVSKSGVGASFGGKGLRYSVNSRGQRRTTVGIPGSGLSYTNTSSSGRAYKTSAYNRSAELAKKQREFEKLQEIERNRLEVELFENKIEKMKSVHKECDDEKNWQEIRNTPPPFPKGVRGPNEDAALKVYEEYKPGFFAKLFKQDEKRKSELFEKIELARKEDLSDYQEWQRMISVAENILQGDIDTYFEVIEEFAPLDDLLEFGSGFEFFAIEPDVMEIEFDVHPQTVVPTQTLSLTKTGKLSVKDTTKTAYYDIQQDYVSSCVIRIVRDMFALLPLNIVYIHAIENRLNSATGHHENNTILSVKFDKSTLKKLNFDAIDCSDALSNFEHRMKFRKTKGFDEVDRLVVK